MALDLTYLLLDFGLTIDNSPVFQSQVLDRLIVQHKNGIDVGLVTTVQDGRRFESVAGIRLRDLEIPFVTVPDGRISTSILRVARGFRRLQRHHPARFVYARGLPGVAALKLAYPIGGPRLVYDHRGDYPGEAVGRGTNPVQRRIMSQIFGFVTRRADYVSCVSTHGADLIRREWRRSQVDVIPSCVDVDEFMSGARERTEVRRELGIRDEDLLLVYSGGTPVYACIDQTLRYWDALATRGDVKFLILSHIPGDWEHRPVFQRLRSSGVLQLQSAGRTAVPSYLAAADIGFLLREKNRVNLAASPVKFAEYLAAGLAVVTSPGLGDVGQLVQERQLGLLLPSEPNADALSRLESFLKSVTADRQHYSTRAKRAAREVLDWSQYLGKWRRLFQS